MVKVGLLAKIVAKPGLEDEVAGFLTSAVELARQEGKTVTWYAFRASHNEFGVFDNLRLRFAYGQAGACRRRPSGCGSTS